MRSLLPLLMVALSCAPRDEVHSRTDSILGGAADATANTTFLLDLRFDTGASICSAVLISPRVLLTAAHCVDPVFHGATTISVRATNKPDTVMLMQSDMIDVTVISRHPSWNPADQQSDFDLAAILLARAPTGVTPPALISALPTDALGQQIRVIGYGRTSVSDGTTSGTRRTVTLPITAVTAADLTFGTNGVAGICAGDSGGPSFLGAAVAGIHSRTEGTSCGVGVDIRVDRHSAFINAFVAANDPPVCTSDGSCVAGCGTSDPDCLCVADQRCDANCGSTPDPDCRCVADQRCDANCGATPDPDCLCLSDQRCDLNCGPTPDPDCPCQADQRCDSSCGLTDPDCDDDGAVCTLAATCAGSRCLEDPRGFQFCSRDCTSSSECLNEMTCQAGVCRAPPNLTKPDVVAGGCSSAPLSLGWSLVLLLSRRQRSTRDQSPSN